MRLPWIVVVSVWLQIGIDELYGSGFEPRGEPAHFFFAEGRPYFTAAIGASCAINAGPNTSGGFPYLFVHFVKTELAIAFYKEAKLPILVSSLLGKRTNLNEINGHKSSMKCFASGYKLNFVHVFLAGKMLVWYMNRYREGIMGWGYAPYVPVAERRAKALRDVQRFVANGRKISPVEIVGRIISSTFWGKAWCDNLESYSDFENRLPRGRTYVRNGSVVDLQIEPGQITSLVSGSRLYRITIDIQPLAKTQWENLKQQCSTGIGSVVELLQGRLSTSVMALVTSRESGLFPAPAEIKMLCSCPDWADMCKHVAATMYGVANRLDHKPELLFKLRQVDHLELIAQVGSPTPKLKGGGRKIIAKDQLADVFGIELESDGGTNRSEPAEQTKSKRNRKTVAAEEMSNRTGTRRVRVEASPALEESTSAKRTTLTAKAKKRIAEAQRKRWQAYRERMASQSNKESSLSSAPQKKSAKAKLPPATRSKSTRRGRDV